MLPKQIARYNLFAFPLRNFKRSFFIDFFPRLLNIWFICMEFTPYIHQMRHLVHKAIAQWPIGVNCEAEIKLVITSMIKKY